MDANFTQVEDPIKDYIWYTQTCACPFLLAVSLIGKHFGVLVQIFYLRRGAGEKLWAVNLSPIRHLGDSAATDQISYLSPEQIECYSNVGFYRNNFVLLAILSCDDSQLQNVKEWIQNQVRLDTEYMVNMAIILNPML